MRREIEEMCIVFNKIILAQNVCLNYLSAIMAADVVKSSHAAPAQPSHHSSFPSTSILCQEKEESLVHTIILWYQSLISRERNIYLDIVLPLNNKVAWPWDLPKKLQVCPMLNVRIRKWKLPYLSISLIGCSFSALQISSWRMTVMMKKGEQWWLWWHHC